MIANRFNRILSFSLSNVCYFQVVNPVQHSPQKPKPKLSTPERVTRSTGLENEPPGGPPSQPQNEKPPEKDHGPPTEQSWCYDRSSRSESKHWTEETDWTRFCNVHGNIGIWNRSFRCDSDEFALLKAVLDPSTVVHLPNGQVVKVLSVALGTVLGSSS